MIWALIRKDAGLLRTYLRSAIFATLACYLASIALVLIMIYYEDENAQNGASRALLICKGGSNCGFVATYFFAALLAGSVFTLERSDRSAEFLACLPPTRLQNLMSKLAVVLVATMMMISVHLFFAWLAHLFRPYVRGHSAQLSEQSLISVLYALNFVAIIVSVVGGALATSAWLKSNGVPILCGLFMPAFVASIVSLIGWVLEIPSEGDAFVIRYATSSLVFGVTFGYLGCYWYLTRSEP